MDSEMPEEKQFPIGLRVLAVDHDETCLLLLQQMLSTCDQYQVTTRKESKAALELVRDKKNKFDLIIAEIEMPELDGFKLTELIISEEADIPILLMSNNNGPKSNADFMEKTLLKGAYFYLIKPFPIDLLKNVCRFCIIKHKVDKEKNEEHRLANTFNHSLHLA